MEDFFWIFMLLSEADINEVEDMAWELIVNFHCEEIEDDAS